MQSFSHLFSKLAFMIALSKLFALNSKIFVEINLG